MQFLYWEYLSCEELVTDEVYLQPNYWQLQLWLWDYLLAVTITSSLSSITRSIFLLYVGLCFTESGSHFIMRMGLSYQGPAAVHSPDKCVSLVGTGDMKGTTQNTADPISLWGFVDCFPHTSEGVQYGVSNGRSLVRINIDSKCKLSEGWVTYISPPPGIYLWGLSVRSIHTNDQEQEDGELFWTVVISPTFPSLCPC